MTTVFTSRHLVIVILFLLFSAIGYLIAIFYGFGTLIAPLISPLLGLVGAMIVPLWDARVKQSILRIEVNSIAKRVSDIARVLINEDPDLVALKVVRNSSRRPRRYLDSFRSRGDQKGDTDDCSLEEAEDLLELARKRARDLPVEIQKYATELENLQKDRSLSFDKLSYYNTLFREDVEYDPDNIAKMVSKIGARIQKEVEKKQNEWSELKNNINAAERRMEKVRTDLDENRSVFNLSVSLINSGMINTAIRVPALLRVYIGQGNYVDVRLMLDSFEEKSEIRANSTSIVSFKSAEIRALPEEDRSLINNHWGQSIPCCLFIEDIQSVSHVSPPIAFAQGLYQKIIYDRLAARAALMPESRWASSQGHSFRGTQT